MIQMGKMITMITIFILLFNLLSFICSGYSLNNQQPTVTITYPKENEYISYNKITIKGTASDPDKDDDLEYVWV